MKNDLFEQPNVVNPGGVYDYFGIYHKKFLYYLSNNVDASVIRHEIDKGSKSHIEVPGSKIPNSHYSGTYNISKLSIYYIKGLFICDYPDSINIGYYQL